MNERIKELAIKSGFKKYKNDDGLYSPYIEGYDIDDELEAFAELIVQECVKSLRKAFPQMTPNEIANMLLKVK
jgi:hypothetical protein